MIHVAPCSCELHVRIRELEAELDRTHPCAMGRCLCPHDSIIIEFEARAEKAEAAARAEASAAQIHYEARQRLEARVAEWKRKYEALVAVIPDGTFVPFIREYADRETRESKGED